MNNLKSIIAISSIGLMTLASACKTKDVEPENSTGSVKLEFANVAGQSPIIPGTGVYKNAAGEDFTVSAFNYYITNISLNGANGLSYKEEDSYHLIKQTEGVSRTFDLAKVPDGTYNTLTFMIGVDSARNTDGAQTGALDPNQGMFWTWNSGYIMLKIEGTSPASTNSGGLYQYHAGGFKGVNSAIRMVTLNFPKPVVVKANNIHVHLEADVLKALNSPNAMSFANVSTIMEANSNTKKLADNYVGMFTVTAVE